MEKKTETIGSIGYRVYKGIIGYIFGLYWDNGKENGSYYLGFRVFRSLGIQVEETSR